MNDDSKTQKEPISYPENVEKHRRLCLALEALISAPLRNAAEKQARELQRAWEKLPPLEDEEEGQKLETRFRIGCELFYERQREFFREMEWKRWANKNLKNELIALVEALDPEKDLHLVIATIKTAQQQWKETGPVAKEESDILWQSFRAACDRNFARCSAFFGELDQQRRENQQKKDLLCQRAEKLDESTEWQKGAEEIKSLREEWENIGPAPKAHDEELNKRFRKVCNRFFEQRRRYFAERDDLRRQNLVVKEEICREAEVLAQANESLWQKKTEMHHLQERWNLVPPLPRDKEQELWARFRAACDRFFSRLDELRRENLAMKKGVCDQVEQLLILVNNKDTDPGAIKGQITALQRQWKEIGPVPREESDSVWQRFQTACNEFFRILREYHVRHEQEYTENQRQKEQILARVLSLTEEEPTSAHVEEIKRLQKEWKSIGPALKEQETELQRRFQESCHAFFNRRREIHITMDQERLENLKKKGAICFQLEKLVGLSPSSKEKTDQGLSLADELKLAIMTNFIHSGTRQNRAEEIRRLQEEWKTIGPVPRDLDKPLHTRYRRALDSYYKNRQ